jgi:hypothetical protein
MLMSRLRKSKTPTASQNHTRAPHADKISPKDSALQNSLSKNSAIGSRQGPRSAHKNAPPPNPNDRTAGKAFLLNAESPRPSHNHHSSTKNKENYNYNSTHSKNKENHYCTHPPSPNLSNRKIVTNQWGLTQFHCETKNPRDPKDPQNLAHREIRFAPKDPPSTAKKRHDLGRGSNGHDMFLPEDVMGIGEDMCYLKSKVETYQRSQHDLIHRLRKENDGLWRQNESWKEFEGNYQREVSL